MIQLFDSEQQLLKLLGTASILQVNVGGLSYCLVKAASGYFLIEPTCPHSNYPMSDGKVNNVGEIVCMWHAYRFDLSTGNEKFNRCRPLKSFPITKNQEGGLSVDL